MNAVFYVIINPTFNFQVSLTCRYHFSLSQINFHRCAVFRDWHLQLLVN